MHIHSWALVEHQCDLILKGLCAKKIFESHLIIKVKNKSVEIEQIWVGLMFA